MNLHGTSPSHHTLYIHAEQNIVLRTDSQILSNGTKFRANVFAQDVGCTRGGWEQSCQDGPIRKWAEKHQ